MADKQVPGFTAEPNLEAKLDGLDDHLEPINDKPKEVKDEPAKPAEDVEAKKEEEPVDKKDEPKADDDTKPSEDEPKKDDKEPVKDDEGYTIDEGEEAKDEPKADEPAKSTLTPEQNYILENVTPIKVKGTVGNDEKVQEFTVLSPENLPQGFKYIDDRESATANKQFAMLENKAVELQTEFRNQETQKSAKAFKESEDNADRSDIGTLQRDGSIPKFKVEPTDPNFTKDPASVLIQEVLDFKEKQNSQYLEEANAGRPYKHIGFNEAFLMYKRENPVKVDSAQKKEDEERVALAKRTSAPTGAKDNESLKPRVHSGMGSMDLDKLIDSKTEGW
jgi:hypothetical protein